MKLYYTAASGHAHRALLMLSLLGLDHELIVVNLKEGEQKTAEFLKLNAFGQVPVLIDGDVTIADSTAILVYLAKRYGNKRWLPEEAAEAAYVQRWLSVASGEIAFGPAAARMITLFGDTRNPKEVAARAHRVLGLMNAQLEGRGWLVGDHPSIADVAIYSYVARAPEGDVDLSGYPNVMSWLNRVEGLPGFVEFKKTPRPAAQTA